MKTRNFQDNLSIEVAQVTSAPYGNPAELGKPSIIMKISPSFTVTVLKGSTIAWRVHTA
jgi:hypothetical protein